MVIMKQKRTTPPIEAPMTMKMVLSSPSRVSSAEVTSFSSSLSGGDGDPSFGGDGEAFNSESGGGGDGGGGLGDFKETGWATMLTAELESPNAEAAAAGTSRALLVSPP